VLSKGERVVLKKLENYPERVRRYREKEKHNAALRQLSN